MLAGRVAVITGAGNGLGRAEAIAMAARGASVIVNDIGTSADGVGTSSDPADKVVADIRKAGGTATASYDSVAIDILVNNAGVLGPYFTVEEYPEEIWDRVIAVNLKGTFLCCKAVLPVMRKQGSGSIINIASVAGKEGNASMAPYSASKGAIITLTKTLGKELATSGIRVNCVSPALLETDMAKAMTPEQRALLTSKIPMGRLGNPEEVAAVVKFLASDESSFVTGQCYDVSGGRSVY
jgi:3-oxoacyl-[acyl-carrier protein] reductase